MARMNLVGLALTFLILLGLLQLVFPIQEGFNLLPPSDQSFCGGTKNPGSVCSKASECASCACSLNSYAGKKFCS